MEFSVCGSNKCYLGPKFMDSMGLKLGDWIQIQSNCCSYLCNVWPRKDRAEGYIQYDPTLVRWSGAEFQEYCRKCLLEKIIVTQRHISQEKIQKISHEKLNSVTLGVIFEDHKDVSKHKKQYSSDDLKRKVSSTLRNICVCAGLVVKSHNLNLGRLHKTCFILVKQISGKSKHGLIAAKTKIKIEDISSKDRFEQKVKQYYGKKLGGLTMEKEILIDTITLPFKYPSAQEKFGIQFIRGILLRGPAGCGKTCLVRLVLGFDIFQSGVAAGK